MPDAVLQSSPARASFDAVADIYDETFSCSLIGRAQRDAVTRELDRVFHPGQRILEINCGTGIDALHLAGRGIEVLACDSSPRMVEVARRKALRAFLNVPPQFRVIGTEEIKILGDQEGSAAFDGVFSNCPPETAQGFQTTALGWRPGSARPRSSGASALSWSASTIANLRAAFPVATLERDRRSASTDLSRKCGRALSEKRAGASKN